MHVLMISPYPTQPGMVHGGIQAVAGTLVSALIQQDEIEHLYVLSFYTGSSLSTRSRTSGKLTTIFLKASGFLEASTFFLVDRIRAMRIASQLCPDVVHGQGIGKDGYIASHIDRHSVVTVHGVSSVEARLTAYSLKGCLNVWLADRRMASSLRHAKVVVSTSQYDAQIVKTLAGGHHALIHNPVSPSFFADAGQANRQDNRERSEVLYAGVVSPRKNLLGLIRAFRRVQSRIPGAHLTLIGPVGDATYAQECTRLVQDLRLESCVSYMGYVKHETLVEHLRACHAVILFSNEETSPTIIAQAMAAGRPVISSKVGGVPELVLHGKTGWLVQPGDEYALSDAIISILQESDLARLMGMRAREYAIKQFDSQCIARATVKIYKIAASDSKSSTSDC